MKVSLRHSRKLLIFSFIALTFSLLSLKAERSFTSGVASVPLVPVFSAVKNAPLTTKGVGIKTDTTSSAVVAPPTISKAFAPASIPLFGTTTLSLTITNPNAGTALTGINVTDTLPAGMEVDGTPGATNTCGGTFAPTAGATSLTLTGSSAAISGTCTLSVKIKGTIPGALVNTTDAISSTESGTGATSNPATLTIVAPPTVAKVFDPNVITTNGTSTLIFTITNTPVNTVALTGVSLADSFPSGLVVDNSPNASNTCGGTFTPVAGMGTVALTGGLVAVNSSCILKVNVKGTTSGTKTNISFPVNSSNGGTGGSASATILVNSPPSITAAGPLARTQGAGTSNSTIATVSDDQTPAVSLVVTASSVPTGITVSNFQISNGGTVTANVTADCTATTGANTVGLTVTDNLNVTATANLIVNVTAPTVNITTQPLSQTVCQGGSVTFNVAATGIGTLTYQWRRNSSPINGAIGSSFTIPATLPSDAGSYDVVVTEACNSLLSGAATLTVNTPPTVTTSPLDRNTTVGSTVNLSTAASGTPTPDVVWQVSTTGGASFTNILGATSGILTLSNVSLAMNGNKYRAVFSNNCGVSNSSAATLTVTAGPTTTTIAGSGSSTFGQAASFTATVLNGSTPVAEGSVTFKDGSIVLGTALLNGSGQASLSINSLGAGTHHITAEFNGTSNYLGSISSTSVSITVSKATLTVTANAAAKVYAAPLPTFSAGYTGFVNGDTTTVVSGAPAFTTTATASSSVSTYPITLSTGTLSASNYDFNFVNGTLSVTKAPLTITVDNFTRGYGTNNPGLTISFTGLVNGDVPTAVSGTPLLTTIATASSPVGTYPIILDVSGLSAVNYTITGSNGTLTITKAVLLVTADDAVRGYGASNPNFTYRISGFVIGDTASVISGTPSLSTTATVSSPVGTYAIVPDASALLATNYSFTASNGTLTVTKAVLTVKADNAARSYGAANPGFTDTVTGLLNGDPTSVITGTPVLTTSATTNSAVGIYPITVDASGLSATNYSFTASGGTLTVTKAVLTVKADNAARSYGVANPSFTYTVTGLLNSDTTSVITSTPALATSANPSSPVGTYPITADASGLSATNYSFTTSSGTLSVTQAVLTVKADNAARSYGAANPGFTYTVTGFLNGDPTSVITGTPALTTTATTNSTVGTWPITVDASGLSATNYSFTTSNGTLTVTQVVLTVTAENKTKVYGAALPALTATYAGFVNGDTVAVLSGAPTVTTTATTGSGVGTVPITATAGTLSAANYSFTFGSGTLTITPAALTVKADDKTKAYGAALPAFTATYTGFVNSETESVLSGTLSLNSTATATSAAGTYPITPSGVTSANYTINFVNGALTVTAASSTLTVVTNNNPAAFGQSVTLTATISTAGAGAAATGTVTFKDGATVLGTGTLNGAGQATLTISSLSAGSHSITIEYGGDNNYNAATSAALTLTVAKALTTTTVISSSNPVTVSQPVTFTASVSSSSGAPTGTVEFFDGATSLGIVTLSGNTATLTTSSLTSGSHSITAVYSGGANFASSSSAVVAQIVTLNCTYTLSKTNLVADVISATYSVTITTRSDCAWTATSNDSWITITGGGSGTGNGTVTFTVAPLGNNQMRTGTITIAGQTLTIAQARSFTVVSAASYDGSAIASDEVLAGFGSAITTLTDTATTIPLSDTLSGLRVKIRDSAGVERFGQLLFISPLQINFIAPTRMANGSAMVTVLNGTIEIAAGVAEVATVAPGLFAANSAGSGPAAAQALRVRPDSSQVYEPVSRLDTAQNQYVSVPIDLDVTLGATGDEVYLVLFGTGLRYRTSQSNVLVKIGGLDGEVVYAGIQGDFVGLDQINVRLPRSLSGRGDLNVVLTVDGRMANAVKINVR